MKKLTTEFKRSLTSLADNKRSGRLIIATTTDNIEKVHQMVLDDHRIKVREIAETVGISKKLVYH